MAEDGDTDFTGDEIASGGPDEAPAADGRPDRGEQSNHEAI